VTAAAAPWRAIVLALLAVIAAATGYEAAVALGVVEIGNEPGEGPVGEGVVVGAALAALLAVAIVTVVLALRRAAHAPPAVQLLPLAGVAFTVARFYAYDPYYAPTLRRASEDGLVGGRWIAGLVVAAALAAVLTRLRPRAGLLLGAVVLLVSAFTALATRGGH
jgi:hypothetical protein